MKEYPFSSIALTFGAVILAWSALPWEVGQDAFFVFIALAGPSLVFSAAIATVAIVVYGRSRGLWLLLLSPLFYITGGHILINDDVLGVWSPLIASLASALVFLAAARLLLFRKCPWTVALGWGSLAVLAGIPLFPPAFKLDANYLSADYLGNFWFWGLHIFVWYMAVGFALDKIAGSSEPLTFARAGAQHQQ